MALSLCGSVASVHCILAQICAIRCSPFFAGAKSGNKLGVQTLSNLLANALLWSRRVVVCKKDRFERAGYFEW